jgi:hypothetical protein
LSIAAPADFAATEEEARSRFEAFRSSDPFPDIPPSLLNTADLLDYIAATGMIFPFQMPADLAKGLKPASCAVAFSGRVMSWSPDLERPGKFEPFDKDLKPGEILKLPPNSIVFITLQPYFRLPDYIALQFNLEIKQIYRGLLVGTGPLVDPGFEGFLSVPVHNLTANDYELRAGDPLVWMDFTKLSPNRRWDIRARISGRPFVPFPPQKLERKGLDDYLKAAASEPIVSSIPVEVGRARHAAESAKKSVAVLRNVSVVAGLFLLVAIASLVLQTVTAVRDEGKDRSALERRVTTLSQTTDAQQRRLRMLRLQVRRLSSKRF